jgi:transcriptional regulator with XRE-family HTH domain
VATLKVAKSVGRVGDLGSYIREQRRTAQISLRQLAQQAGVSNPYLSQIERGLRRPSAEVLQQIGNALRISTPVMYLRAGLLEARESGGFLAALDADDGLNERQKGVLTEIYETFRRENAAEETSRRENAAEETFRRDSATEAIPEQAPRTDEYASGANGVAHHLEDH